MIKIKCKECKNELNIFNSYCPNCRHKTKRNLIIIATGVVILLLVTMFIIKAMLVDNKDYYSQRKINKIKLNSDTKELLENNGVSEELVTGYLQDYMEQYNNAFKNETIIETTAKGKKFTNYFNNYFHAKYQDEFTNVILEFEQLDYLNAKYIVKELQIEINFFSEEEPKVIINEKYFEYKNDIKKEIDYILEKYFD